MSRFAILLIAMLLTGVSAFAEDSTQPASPPTARKHAHRQLEPADKKLKRMSKRLGLTDDQKEKIRPILQDEDKQMKSLEDDTSMTQQQKHNKMREIHMASRSQMDGILTPEQKEKLQSGKGGHEGRRHRQPGSTTAPTSDQTSPQ